MLVNSFPVLTSKWLHMIGSSDSNHRQLKCLFNILFELTTKETSKLHIPGTFWDESTSDQWIPSQRASNAESVFMSWRGLVIKMSNEIILKNVRWDSRLQWLSCRWSMDPWIEYRLLCHAWPTNKHCPLAISLGSWTRRNYGHRMLDDGAVDHSKPSLIHIIDGQEIDYI